VFMRVIGMLRLAGITYCLVFMRVIGMLRLAGSTYCLVFMRVIGMLRLAGSTGGDGCALLPQAPPPSAVTQAGEQHRRPGAAEHPPLVATHVPCECAVPVCPQLVPASHTFPTHACCVLECLSPLPCDHMSCPTETCCARVPSKG